GVTAAAACREHGPGERAHQGRQRLLPHTAPRRDGLARLVPEWSGYRRCTPDVGADPNAGFDGATQRSVGVHDERGTDVGPPPEPVCLIRGHAEAAVTTGHSEGRRV